MDDDLQRSTRANLRRTLRLEAQESHARGTRLTIERFHQTVCSDIAIENVDLGLWTDLFDLHRILHCLPATQATAIRSLRSTRTNALEHDNGFQILDFS